MKKKYLVPVILLLVVATVQFVTMPAFFYPGDNFAIRAEAANWVNTGKLGIDYSRRAELGGMLAEKGQYFYENDKKQMFFSRYGFGDTVLFIPPYAVYKAIYGPLPPMGTPDELLFIMNCYLILFSTGSALLLYLTAGLFTSKRWLQTVFALASLYGTFCAHYLKQPIHDNFQMTISLAFFYFALRFFLHESEKRPWWNIGAASLSAGILLTTKSSFVIYFAALGLAILIDGFLKHGFNLKAVVWQPLGKYFLWVGIPAALALAVVLISNGVRFSSPLDSGYHQWIRNGLPKDRFELAFLQKSIPRFFWQKGNANIFLHYPLIILAIPGFALLFRKNKAAFWFFMLSIMLTLAMICPFSGWSGEWCYGPRHLMFILMAASVPAICLTEKVLKANGAWKWVVLSVSGLILIFSAWSNFQVNALQCFASHQVSSVFAQIKVPQVSTYFKGYFTRSHFFRDIRLHAQGKKIFPPLEEIKKYPNAQAAYRQLDHIVKMHGRPNYFFASKQQ